MDKFLNFYSKYPWVALVLIMQWTATAFTVIYAEHVNVTNIMGVAFFTTVIFAYFGFKVPKG